MAGGWGVLAPKLLFSCNPRTIGGDQGCLTLLPSYCQKPCNWIKYPWASEDWFVRLAPMMRSHSSGPNEMPVPVVFLLSGRITQFSSPRLHVSIDQMLQCWTPSSVCAGSGHLCPPQAEWVCHGLWWIGDVACIICASARLSDIETLRTSASAHDQLWTLYPVQVYPTNQLQGKWIRFKR